MLRVVMECVFSLEGSNPVLQEYITRGIERSPVVICAGGVHTFSSALKFKYDVPGISEGYVSRA